MAVGRFHQKADQQYDISPTSSQPKKKLQEVVAHHQHQHAEGEQRDVGEEALVAGSSAM